MLQTSRPAQYAHTGATMAVVLLAALACKGLDETGDPTPATSSSPSAATSPTARPSASPAALPPATSANAGASAAPANAPDVTRFPDETKINNEPATLEWSSSKIRKKPQGDVVVSLPKSTRVTKVAERQGFFLITFADPKDPSRQLMGWVYKDAFSGEGGGATPLHATPSAGDKCPAGMVFREDAATGKHCNRACKTNAQCGEWMCYSGACISPQGE